MNSKNLNTGKLFTMLSVTQGRNERSMEGGRGKKRQRWFGVRVGDIYDEGKGRT